MEVIANRLSKYLFSCHSRLKRTKEYDGVNILIQRSYIFPFSLIKNIIINNKTFHGDLAVASDFELGIKLQEWKISCLKK